MKKNENTNLNINKLIVPILLVIVILLLVVVIVILFKDDDNDYRDKYLDDRNEVFEKDNFLNDNNGTEDENYDKYISKQEALNVALKDVGISQDNIRDLDIELDYKYSQMVYEVDFNYQQYEYEYYINAEDGKIVKSFKERD